MNRSQHKKKPVEWKEIFSAQIFKLDVIDGFKYRKKQALFFLITTLTLLSLVGWGIICDMFASGERSYKIGLIILFYLPAIIGLIYWFRACLTYDFNRWKISEQRRPSTKKSVQAVCVFKISLILFILYFVYWMRYLRGFFNP